MLRWDFCPSSKSLKRFTNRVCNILSPCVHSLKTHRYLSAYTKFYCTVLVDKTHQIYFSLRSLLYFFKCKSRTSKVAKCNLNTFMGCDCSQIHQKPKRDRIKLKETHPPVRTDVLIVSHLSGFPRFWVWEKHHRIPVAYG